MSSRSRNFWSATLVALALSAGFASAAPGFAAPPRGWAGAASSASLTPVSLRGHLAAMRRLQIERLKAYRKAGQFPVNRTVPGMAHFFIDPQSGALCAMANLIAQSGHLDWVREQAKTDNAIELGRVTSGRLYDWMLDSGLTQEEINFIQEPGSMVRPVMPPDPVLAPPELRPTVEQENARIDAHLKLVVAVLERSTKASLDLAVARAQAHQAALAAMPAGAKAAIPTVKAGA